jgi:hypothetical protein
MSCIYVIQGDNAPGLTKIGVTDQAPEVIAQELSGNAGEPGDFIVVRQWRLKNAELYAKRICGVLGCYRISGEDFRLPVEETIRRIITMLHAWGVVNDEGLTKEEAAAQCAERARIEAAKREEERQRQINAEVTGAEAEAARQFQGPTFPHRIFNAFVWCMTWAIIEITVHVELADRLHLAGWQYLAHLVGLIGLYLVLRGPSAKCLAERDDAMREARRRVLSAHGLPASWRPSP